MNTYPEMNEKIVGLLRISDNPVDLYAAQYIEELQKQVCPGALNGICTVFGMPVMVADAYSMQAKEEKEET
jgi:hypothetical protein